MESAKATQKSRNLISVLMFVQFVAIATIFIDMPIARQVLGFLYFSVVPGFVIVKLLSLENLDGLETLLLSIGLSIAFLMLLGLLINELGPILGLSSPLSLIPLMIVLNGSILVIETLSFLRKSNAKIWMPPTLKESALMLLLTAIPALSIAGAIWVNLFGNNTLLLIMLIVVSIAFSIGAISQRLLPAKLYPFALLVIAIALLFHSSLISNYIVPFGSDVPFEYFTFKNTASNMHWNLANPYLGDEIFGRLNAMLSITIFPTVISTLLGIDPTWVFKILYPLIFSFVPLVLYKVWQTDFGSKNAFIAAFLFMAQATFYTEMLGLNRQMIAELFFALLLLIILSKKMNPSSKIVLFTIFSFALITSHYALGEIFLFFITFVVISLFVSKSPSRKITTAMVTLFFVIMFSWYLYISSSAVFDSLLSFGEYVYSQLGDFFNPASRGQTVLIGLGVEAAPTIWNAIGRIFAYITQAFIVFGLIALIMKRTKTSIDREHLIFILVAMAFLALLILVPGLANTMNMTRFYHILLFFLAPLCVLGAQLLARLASQRKQVLVSVLLIATLVPYFLFQTGFVYEITGSDSWSVPLSEYRMNPLRLYGHFGYIDVCSISGAQWLSSNTNFQRSVVYSDSPSRYNVLTSYGMIYRGSISELSNTTVISSGGVAYLSTLAVTHGIIISGYNTFNASELSPIFNHLCMIYSNGACEIYKNPR